MKKTLQLLLIVLSTIAIQAQTKLLSSMDEVNNNSTWERSGGTNYSYDNNNNLTEELYFNFENSAWKNSGKSTYTYNANNNVTETFEYDWNQITNQFEVEDKTVYKYVNNKLTEIEFFEWTGVWESYGKFTITFNNNLPAVLNERFFENGQWNENRTTYTYNASNKVISTVEEKLVGVQWVNNRKALYTYNANNKLITVRGADWDEFNNNWRADLNNAYEYTLDAQGNRIRSVESTYEQNFTYDPFALMSSFAHPFKDKTGLDYFTEDYPYINKLLTTTSSGGANRITYNYNSSITLDTKAAGILDKSITVYPNPTTDFLNIQNQSNSTIDKMIVIDLTGKKIFEQNNSNPIDVQNLSKGMYVLEVISGGNKMVEKFIKE